MPQPASVLSLLIVMLGTAAARDSLAPPPGATDLVVIDTAGVARRNSPVTIGVPLPRGHLRQTVGNDAVALRIEGRRGSVADARALERWPDGSIRWLLLDFQDTVPALGRVTRRLAAAATLPAPDAPPSLTLATPDGVRSGRVDLLSVTVPARGPILAALRAGAGEAIVMPWPALVVEGSTLLPPDVEGVTIEREAPLRSEIVVRARHAIGLRHEVRVATFADQPVLRVRYTLTHMGTAPYLRLEALPFTLPWRATAGELAIDGRVHAASLRSAPRSLSVTHREPQIALLDGAPAGRHADGFARVRGDGAAWSLAVPRFWEEYPQSLTVSSGSLVFDPIAARGDPLLFGVGAAKTWEFWIAVHPDAEAPPLVALGRSLTTPVHAFVSPLSVVESRALPYAITLATPGADAFLSTLRREIERYRARATAERWEDGPPGACTTRRDLHPRVGFYGALNWGDWNFPGLRDDTKGCDAWGNLEYDLPLVLGLAALATQDPDTFTLFQDAAHHYRDVDIIHHWPGHEQRVGLNHPHKVRHFATDAPNTVDLGHVWLDGLLLHYRLTGEVRSRDAVVRMADALTVLPERASNPRQFGWPMIALAAAFEATAEPRYRAACLAFATDAARRFPPDANGEWKMGILAEGMMAAHRATGEATTRRWLDDYGRQLLVPGARPRDARLVIPAGYLYELTGDPRFADLARTTAAQLTPGNWGKSLASVGRTGFALLAPLALRTPALTPVRVAPRPLSPPERQRSSPPHTAPSPPSDR